MDRTVIRIINVGVSVLLVLVYACLAFVSITDFIEIGGYAKVLLYVFILFAFTIYMLIMGIKENISHIMGKRGKDGKDRK